MTMATLTIELCSLCPVEPACERKQMLEAFGCARDDADAMSPGRPFAVKGQPYRCWLLSARDAASSDR